MYLLSSNYFQLFAVTYAISSTSEEASRRHQRQGFLEHAALLGTLSNSIIWNKETNRANLLRLRLPIPKCRRGLLIYNFRVLLEWTTFHNTFFYQQLTGVIFIFMTGNETADWNACFSHNNKPHPLPWYSKMKIFYSAKKKYKYNSRIFAFFKLSREF